jgi:hypothetical protein
MPLVFFHFAREDALQQQQGHVAKEREVSTRHGLLCHNLKGHTQDKLRAKVYDSNRSIYFFCSKLFFTDGQKRKEI